MGSNKSLGEKQPCFRVNCYCDRDRYIFTQMSKVTFRKGSDSPKVTEIANGKARLEHRPRLSPEFGP